MPQGSVACPWSEMSDEHEAPRLCIQTSPTSSDPGEQGDDAYSDFDDDEETEAPSSPSSTRKRRIRRRRRHGKNKASTSTASTASGGNSPSEDDGGRTPADRGVVTWRDLGLGLGVPGLKGVPAAAGQRSPAGRLAVARCELAGQPLPTPPPPPTSPPDVLRDASERVIPVSPFGRQPAGSHWYAQALDPGMGTGWVPCWEPPNSWQGRAPLTPLASTPMGMPPDHMGLAGFGSAPCSPTGASPLALAPPLPVPTAAAVPSWLRGCGMPVGGEDLAHQLRAMAPETYED